MRKPGPLGNSFGGEGAAEFDQRTSSSLAWLLLTKSVIRTGKNPRVVDEGAPFIPFG